VTTLVQSNKSSATWKALQNVDDGLELVDVGILLSWSDMRHIAKHLDVPQQAEVIRHFARRLAERSDMRLSAEIIVESLMIWLASSANEALVAAFLEELLVQPKSDAASRVLVEIALTVEPSEDTHDTDIFSMSVALVCELGLAIQAYESEFPGQFPHAQSVLDHIATYLLSVSNSNNSCIRLSLLHYFGATEQGLLNKTSFNRIMGRFGHTVLDHLFILLFRKRSEAVALQYLHENLPFVLEADQHSQRIVHETFKFYMLKHPERFSLFVQSFADVMLAPAPIGDYGAARRVFAQHLGALLRVVSEVNHKALGRELIIGLVKLTADPECAQIVRFLSAEESIRASMRDVLSDAVRKTSGSNVQAIENVAALRSTKRGRKPSFARTDKLGTIHQVSYLGQIDIQKAS
jgi:hypothetical protein